MPFLGILDDKNIPHVPGTVILEEVAAHSEVLTSALKHGTGPNAHIVLVPQPSDDPNDPLNWPQWKKRTALGVTVMGEILYGAVVSAMLNPAFYALSYELNTTVTDMVLTTGYQCLVTAVTAPFYSAISRKWGSRPLFLGGCLIMVVAQIVGGSVHSYTGVLTARIIQGFAVAPFESLIFVLISDMFFVHERGVYAAIVNFALIVVTTLVTVVSGPIIENMGYRWTFWLLLIFGCCQAVFQFLFVPETSFKRDSRYEIDELQDDNLKGLVALEHQSQLDQEKALGTAQRKEDVAPSTTSQNAPEAYRKKTFQQELAILGGKYSDENLLQLTIAPYLVPLNLMVAWIIIINAMFILLYVVIAFTLSQLFAPPPYHLSGSAIGYLSLGPFIAGLIVAVLVGIISDPLIKWCSRKNNGIYEPEYRLLPGMLGVLAGTGLFLFGYTVSEGKSYYAVSTAYGILLGGCMFVEIATSNYVLDAYRSMATEIFIASFTLKNYLLYGWGYWITDWTAKVGARHAFFVWGGLAFGLLATLPLVLIFGKKYRSLWARHNLLEKLHVKTHAE
ncbi:serine/threonine kinase 16 [Leptodontidium sp. MPI-SDFR-AT-0119]|nr:serine/threonine kinase 16 [Leptodontidium sp. MPI-SDFR-AT-0119]